MGDSTSVLTVMADNVWELATRRSMAIMEQVLSWYRIIVIILDYSCNEIKTDYTDSLT